MQEWIVTAIKIASYIIVAFIIWAIFSRFITRGINKATRTIKGARKIDQSREKTIFKVVLSIVKVTLILVVTFLVLSELGVNIAPLLAGAGIIGFAISFGSQSIVKDFISGMFILVEDQFRVGDVIEIDDLRGIVKELNLRHTVLKSFEGDLIFVPNNVIQKVKNFRDTSRISVVFEEVDARKAKDELLVKINELHANESFKTKFIHSCTLKVRQLTETSVKVYGNVIPPNKKEIEGILRDTPITKIQKF